MNKNILFLIAFVFALISCNSDQSNKIELKNSLGIDRVDEMVEVKLSLLKNVDFNTKSYILKDIDSVEIPYQISGQSLIFQATVPANATSVYLLTEGKAMEFNSKTSARHIPERKDDFAWENDLAAYRMYGPALANENPSNGVDLWLKCTNELIVDKFYYDELNKGLSYHVDHGQGLDCYKVGHTLGAGGIAPYTSQVWVGNHYNQYEVHENGPLRSSFTLTYDSIKVEDKFYKQTIRITTEAGAPLNKAIVTLEGENMPMQLAGGIILHNGEGVQHKNADIIAYAENAVSDAGISSGRNYVGIYIPSENVEIKTDDMHLLAIANYDFGEEFVYYFGGGWSKWQFNTDEEWFNALEQFKIQKENPLEIIIK